MSRTRRAGLPPAYLLGLIGMLTAVLLLLGPFPAREQLQSRIPRAVQEEAVVLPHNSILPPVATVSSSLDVNTFDEKSPSQEISVKVPLIKRSTTIVSGFFDMSKLGQKTKHDPDFYLRTGRDGVLSFDTPCIFFTDSPKETLETIKKTWSKHPSKKVPDHFHIVNISLFDFDVAKAHLKRVTELIPRDVEAKAFGYSGLLFTIYHAKPEMMRRAAELNPFNSERFLWMDVGAVRDWGGIEANKYRFKQFPSPEREYLIGRNGKILLGGVAGSEPPCPNSVRWVDAEKPEGTIDPPHKVEDPITVTSSSEWWIAGAIWGGHKNDLRAYETLYRQHLARYLARDSKLHFSLIDQYLMGALACHSHLIEVVRPPGPCCVDRVNRKWFFLLMFLRTSKYPQAPYSRAEFAGKQRECTYCDLVGKVDEDPEYS